ncbi:MAG: hypothetical protein JW845_03920 [Dehalococcoidales bacterium]|nr:hypothetical protein [Dehalococcoidales bacterium]
MALMVIPLVISVVLLAGCTDTEPTTTTNIGYLKATATKLGINFTFEYPDSYIKLTPVAFEDTGGDNSINLLYVEPGTAEGKADKQIQIIPLAPIKGRPNAVAWANEHITILEINDEEFELIERSTIEVAGISGEMIAYKCSILGNYMNSPNLIIRDVYLDYQGYIWKISVLSITELGAQVEPDFDHLTDTFDFLD